MPTLAKVAAAPLAVTLGVSLGLAAVTAPPATAVQPSFAPADGVYTIDTTALTLSGQGLAFSGTDVGGVAVFHFDTVVIGPGVRLNAVGSRPVEIRADHSLSMAGVIDASGASAVDFSATARPGGAGGGAGGLAGSPGGGPGGGQQALDVLHGGGGGGFGGPGARGGGNQGALSAGGLVHGNLLTALRGGSGGGAAPVGSTTGGGGGGAVALVGRTVTLAAGSRVLADGGGGAVGVAGASAGGSGGGILVRGDSVDLAGTLAARGGPGGRGGCCGDGGGGGGGRITVVYDTSLSQTGTFQVEGGPSGWRTTGTVPPGIASPDPSGGPGVIQVVATSELSSEPALTAPYRARRVLSTRLVQRSDGQPIAGVPVTLRSRPTASSPWSDVATATTSSTGAASTTVTLTTSARYQWVFEGSPGHLGTSSAEQEVSVRPVVSLATTSAKVRRGNTFKLYGTAKPPGAGEMVTLQQKKGTRWVTVASARLKLQKLPRIGRKIGYLFSQRRTSAGKFSFRVVKPPASGLVTGTSKIVTVRVT